MVPEGRHVFATMTVEENLQMGAYLRKDKAGIEEAMKRVYALFPRLKERKKQLAGTMSGGEQQMLANARGLMANPRVLLLDEPSLGLSPVMVETLADTISEIRARGVAVVLNEQNAAMALQLADQAYVMELGSIVKKGTGAELLGNEEVKRAYLGL